MVSLSGAPKQSTAPFTMLPCSVTHQESSGITGKLCFSSGALSHDNRGVPVRRRSLPKAVQEGGRHTPQAGSPISLGLHTPAGHPPPSCLPAAGEFSLTAPSFSASEQQGNSFYYTDSPHQKNLTQKYQVGT